MAPGAGSAPRCWQAALAPGAPPSSAWGGRTQEANDYSWMVTITYAENEVEITASRN